MSEIENRINQTTCQIYRISYHLAETACDRCGQKTPALMQADRTAIDVNLEYPVLLQISVSVHHCVVCQHYFRAQPPFMRPDAIYTNSVVEKAVQAVYEDGMAMRRVPDRLARDFWVRPSEGSVRGWCRAYSAVFKFETDYQPWVVSEFSGVLCVDEVYQDRLALLLAVDPAAPDGDRLVGYQLIHGSVDGTDIETFLSHLKEVGIEPEQVITDGSSLYPTVLKQVWPQAAHQLCLFHETRHLTQAAMKVIQTIRKELPAPPPALETAHLGKLADHPPSDDANDLATQRWYWRQVQRRNRIILVHELAQQGMSQRAIARQTGHNRRTIKRWLQEPIPPLPAGLPSQISEMAQLTLPQQRRLRKQRLRQQVHDLAQEGLSYSAIARQVGIHRVTIKKWLVQDPPSLALEEPVPVPQKVESAPPPDPWSSWAEVRQVREALRKHRFLFMRRPENLSPEEQAQLDTLLTSPVGPQLQVARSFLLDWYKLWTDDDGQRRSIDEAQGLYDAWRANSTYQQVPHLTRVLQKMTPTKFEYLSPFLAQDHWEATNNGVERAGRTFRHLQAPHFNLRQPQAIENLITMTACLRKEAASQLPSQPFHTCQRGRKKQTLSTQSDLNPFAVLTNQEVDFSTLSLAA